jgi:hypothetical protein
VIRLMAEPANPKPVISRTLDRSDEQDANRHRPTTESPDPDSKIALERRQQKLKQQSKTTSTDEAIETHCTDEQKANADSPKHETRQPDSNAKVERASQELNKELAVVSIHEGMQIHRSETSSEGREGRQPMIDPWTLILSRKTEPLGNCRSFDCQ